MAYEYKVFKVSSGNNLEKELNRGGELGYQLDWLEYLSVSGAILAVMSRWKSGLEGETIAVTGLDEMGRYDRDLAGQQPMPSGEVIAKITRSESGL